MCYYTLIFCSLYNSNGIIIYPLPNVPTTTLIKIGYITLRDTIRSVFIRTIRIRADFIIYNSCFYNSLDSITNGSC